MTRSEFRAQVAAQHDLRRGEMDRLRTDKRDGEPLTVEARYERRDAFSLCFTRSELVRLVVQADAAGCSVQGYVRRVLREALRG